MPDNSVYCAFCGKKLVVEKQCVKRRGNHQGTAIRRGATWTAVWTTDIVAVPGTRRTQQVRRWKSGFKSKSAALAYAADPPVTLADVAPMPEEYKPTVRDYYNLWSATDALDLSASKRCAFKIAWQRLDLLADRPISELTIADLQGVIDDQTSTYYPARDMRTLLSHIYKRAVAEGQARVNLSEFIRIPPLEEAARQPFSAEEVQQLWTACKTDRMAELIILMIYTGMMPGELKKLKIDMIDTERREILGCGLKTKKRKTTPIIYPVAVEPIVNDLISTTASTQGYVLGMSEDTFYTEYHASLARAGVRDLPPYSCRHTTATALAMAKTAPSLIQEIMRHTKFATTQRYIHPDMENAHAAINNLPAGGK